MLVTLPVAAVTVAFTTIVIVAPDARLACVTVTPEAVLLSTVPPVTTGVPRLSPALATSVKVTFCAVLGPKFTNVTV